MQQNELFTLIRSLTPHEKGYIRRMAALHRDENNYIRLFDAIDRQKTYDEPALRKKFAKEKFARNFAGAKNYLQNAILRHLESYDTSPTHEVRSLLTQYAVTRRKGLAALGYKLLRRAYELCRKHELDGQRGEVLSALLQHVMRFGGQPAWPGGIPALMELIRESNELDLRMAEMRYELHRLREQTPGMIRARDVAQAEALRQDLRRWQAYDVSQLTSFDSRYLYYTLLTHYSHLCGDVEESLRCSTALCEWMEKNWSYAAHKFSFFVTAFYNKAMSEQVLYRPSSTKTIAVLERLLAEGGPGNANAHVVLNRLRIAQAWETCRYEEVHRIAAAALDFLDRNRTSVHYPAEEMICRTARATAWFATGDLNAAAKELRAVLRDPAAAEAHALTSAARMLQLIVEYERGDRIGLESQVRATYRYLLKKKQLHKVESCVLGFLRSRMHERGDIREAFRKLKQDVELALEDRNEETGVRLFDLVSYLESKISGVPFAEVRRKNASVRWGMEL